MENRYYSNKEKRALETLLQEQLEILSPKNHRIKPTKSYAGYFEQGIPFYRTSVHFEQREKERDLDRKEILGLLQSSQPVVKTGVRRDWRGNYRLSECLIYRRDPKHDIFVVVGRNPGDICYTLVTARVQSSKRRKWWQSYLMNMTDAIEEVLNPDI